MTNLVAVAATGSLRLFSEAGVLALPDVHLARTLATLSGDVRDDVALAVALTLRAWRTGSPCFDIAQPDILGADPDAEASPDVTGLTWPAAGDWLSHLRESPLVDDVQTDTANGSGGQRPLCLDGNLLYLRRTWDDQAVIVSALAKRWSSAPPVPPMAQTGQSVVDATMSRWTHIVTGGPGTGKTTAIGEVVRQLAPFFKVAVAAPTGKATARLAQALGPGVASPVTIHKLLGARGPGRGFTHNTANPLPADLVIVDELSMVSLPLMAALLAALRPHTRLLLVGDPGQLASVEAGAVLADLVEAGSTASRFSDEPLVQQLTHVYRHSGALADLAGAAARGDAEAALAVCDRGDDAVTLIDRDAAGLTWADLPGVASTIGLTAATARQAALAGDAAGALGALDGHRLLCAHRQGPYGVATWARQVAQLTTPAGVGQNDWWPGKAVLATATAPDIGVVSGAQGIALAGPSGVGLAFDSQTSDRTGGLLPVGAVPGLASLDAMTVHKAQGSEFSDVSVVLPPVDSPLLIRPLLYTAMTRARQRLTLIGTRQQLRTGLATAPQRTSGLAAQLRSSQSL